MSTTSWTLLTVALVMLAVAGWCEANHFRKRAKLWHEEFSSALRLIEYQGWILGTNKTDILRNEARHESQSKLLEEDCRMLVWEVAQLTNQITFAENALRYKEREMEKYKRRDILLQARTDNKSNQPDELEVRMSFRMGLPTAHIDPNNLKELIKIARERRIRTCILQQMLGISNWDRYLAREKAIQGGLR